MKQSKTSLLALPLFAILPLQAGEVTDSSTSNDGDFLTPPLAKSPWEVTAAASLALAKGNSDSLSYSLQGLATYEDETWEGLLGVDYLYSENNGNATSDSLRIFGQGQRLLTERFYLGVAASYYQDELSDVDYRVDVAGVLGYHLLKNETTKLSFEAGPGFAWEDQGGSRDTFATIRFGQHFEHQLSAASKLWQHAIFTPKVEDFGDYFLTLEAGLDIRLTDQWGFRTSGRYLYDSSPAAGRGNDDYSLLFGLTYALGGLADGGEEGGRASLFPSDDEGSDPLMGWTSTAALGLSLARGNSDSLSASLVYDAAYRGEKNEVFLGAAYAYGRNNGETSNDAVRLSAQYNRLLSRRLFLGASASYLRDELAEVDYRVTPSAVLGYYLIKNEDVTLSVEGGPSYVFEKVDGEDNNYLSVRAAERFAWNINSRFTFNQSLVVDAEAGNFDNSIATLSAFLDADITSSLSWRLAATYVYDNEPAVGLDEDDLTLTSGIAMKF